MTPSPAANLEPGHAGVRSRSVGRPRFLWRFPSCIQGVRDAENWVPGPILLSVTWDDSRAKFSPDGFAVGWVY